MPARYDYSVEVLEELGIESTLAEVFSCAQGVAYIVSFELLTPLIFWVPPDKYQTVPRSFSPDGGDHAAPNASPPIYVCIVTARLEVMWNIP